MDNYSSGAAGMGSGRKTNYNPKPSQQTTSSAATTGAVRANVAEQRFEPIRQAPSPQDQVDPALLARIAAEEERKKRGGGGGGGGFYNQMTHVPYSFVLIGEAIERARQAFNQALAAASQPSNNNQANPQAANNAAPPPTVMQFIMPMITPMLVLAQNTGKLLRDSMKNVAGFASRMANNVAHVGLTIFSAIANNLKKIFYNKDESATDVEDENYKTDDDNFFANTIRFLGLNDEGNSEENGKTIKAHLDNQARLITTGQKKDWFKIFWKFFKARDYR